MIDKENLNDEMKFLLDLSLHDKRIVCSEYSNGDLVLYLDYHYGIFGILKESEIKFMEGYNLNSEIVFFDDSKITFKNGKIIAENIFDLDKKYKILSSIKNDYVSGAGFEAINNKFYFNIYYFDDYNSGFVDVCIIEFSDIEFRKLKFWATKDDDGKWSKEKESDNGRVFILDNEMVEKLKKDIDKEKIKK